MGWYYTLGASRRDLIRELTHTEYHDNGATRLQTLKYCLRGNILWSIRRVTSLDGKIDTYICCDILVKSRDGWGHKPLDESCGPCYWTCPLSYLEAVPCAPGEYASPWRAGVRNYHAGALAQRRARREKRRWEKRAFSGVLYDIKPIGETR